ncbi:MAG: hypothetical protein COX77_02370 [Candidatus Komeilibacteria bacterium CG_4_10_14_0_2_um_filter_37_10]|uniref:SHS2 domain-containing protein n=1 Tax=Candidatus Komeilibacteria bacterium CG_4_10_14_0_2_um_filter_37_10 TaxID=1974470 RepID=A0A2M7VEY3_9BACT|nr:MAG: hypothetical protein COX77_02370 [Candidatus Komeilibacteria bacterium CG_4_10_14_0_2_um_filter_37_10]PJA92734.1 MAG: hypothetical protein CO133_01625 [Candidatus Komeilibacteria bacterium CG_4_9_14_3_um_filter_37_5]
MGLFSNLFNKKISYLGIDIGPARIKLIQLGFTGKSVNLESFGYIDLVNDFIHDESAEQQQKVVQALKSLVTQSRANCSTVIASLPTYAAFISVINIPKVAAEDIPAAVGREVQKYIPWQLDQVALSWQIAQEHSVGVSKIKDVNIDSRGKYSKIESKQTDFYRILATAIPKNLINRYAATFQAAGLKLVEIETEAFALSRSLTLAANKLTMVIDLGALSSDLYLLDGNLPVLSRSINVGGTTITKSIADNLGVSWDQAEQFKIDFGLNSTNQQSLPPAVMETLNPLITEIKYVLDLYQGQSDKKIEHILLTGGSAYLANLTAYLMEIVPLPVYVANPWEKMIYRSDLKAILEKMGPTMAVAVGLALKDGH